MATGSDPRFPYPRYLTVPFIFVPDGARASPEVAQFKRDHPGWVTFRAALTPNASFGKRGLPKPGDEFDLRVTGYDQPIGRMVVRRAAVAVPVAAATATAAAGLLPEFAQGLEGAALESLSAVGAAAAYLFVPTAANPGEEEALRQYRAAHGGALGDHAFEPPPPAKPLPGLVPPSAAKTKPGEGGFTQAPPGKPAPGFTPAPPAVLVRPGRPAVENKPVVVESGLPPARATRRGVQRFNPKVIAHANAAVTEAQLAIWVQSQPDQQVIDWGAPIGAHGADVISVNVKTGAVTLWDAKYRGESRIIQASGTFKPDTPARANAIAQALEAIENTDLLPPTVRDRAVANLKANRLNTATVGFGGARNSVIGD